METTMIEAAIQQVETQFVHLALSAAVLTVVLLTAAWMAAGLLRTSREL